MSTPGYNQRSARNSQQSQQMKDLAERGVCAFCPENIHSETREPIEIETKYWFVKKNDYPYDRTSQHFLLIPKEHVATVSVLSAPAQQEFMDLVSRVEKDNNLTSYAVAMRSGDMHFNGGSVEHLHAHIIVGDTDHPDETPVKFKVTSRPAKN